MPNLWSKTSVKYYCSCGSLDGISKLLFCRHCNEIKCSKCVNQEVESYFCSNCLEHIPSVEARHKKNVCHNCWQCPCCNNSLSSRASTPVTKSLSGSSKDTSKLTKKVYYLTCPVCRWTSRDIGIPDQITASAIWPEDGYHFQTKFDGLLKHYQEEIICGKNEQQDYFRKKCQRSTQFCSMADRANTTASRIRKHMGLSEKASQKDKKVAICPCEPPKDVMHLSDDMLSTKIYLCNVTSLSQRITQPPSQPVAMDEIHPIKRLLCVKRSLRCSQCEHNLLKPEYLPTSAKYRIHLFASYYVPIVVYLRCENQLTANEPNRLLLRVINPTSNNIVTSIGKIQSRSIADATDKYVHHIADSDDGTINFFLHKRDDSIDFDEEKSKSTDDPSFVVWRKSNKAVLSLPFTPHCYLESGDEVVIAFTMSNTITDTPTDAQNSAKFLTKVFVSAGSI